MRRAGEPVGYDGEAHADLLEAKPFVRLFSGYSLLIRRTI